MDSKYLTVSQLNQYIKRKFDQDPYLEKVYLKGEVSNAARNRANTTMYFSLKDEESVIPVVIFQNVVRNIKFKIEEGMSVFVTGRVSTYVKRGTYQIIVDEIQPDGVGALYQALEQTRETLLKEGLFDEKFKQELIKYPKRIAVITSESGAVIRDIYSTIKRRYPITEIILYPTYVQGESAIPSIVKNIKRADETNSFDTIIIGRGGGSIEDLWAFNDEKVVRTIFEARTPIISSVGHETDTTLSDLVADVRAATPTAAAELATPVLSDIKRDILEIERQISYHLRRTIDANKERVERLNQSYIFRQPSRLYEGFIQNVDYLTDQLFNQMSHQLSQVKQSYQLLENQLAGVNPKLLVKETQTNVETWTKQLLQAMNNYQNQKHNETNQLIQSLDHLSPLETLGRGYSYTTQDQQLVKSVKDVDQSKPLIVNLNDGKIETTINKITRKDEPNG